MKNYKLKVIVLSTLAVISAGCGIGGNYIPSDSIATEVQSFKIISPANSLAIGNKLKLSPVILQIDGKEPKDPLIEWKINDDKVAKIEKDGTLTALSEGNAVIIAKFKGQETSLPITITKLPEFAKETVKESKGTTIQANPSLLSRIKNIEIKLSSETKPNSDYTIETIDTLQNFVVTAYDLDNKPLSGISFEWVSSNLIVATINNKGVLKTLASGSTTLIATAGDKTSNIIRVIVPNGKASINVNFQGD